MSQQQRPLSDPERDSAGTGVAAAWWKSAHGAWWLCLLAVIAALAWWVWR